jgi:hypothetical protein
MAEALKAVPAGLIAACGVLRSHSAQLVTPSPQPASATEAAGVAAVELTSAFERFSIVFGQRLSSVSTALSKAAGAYTAMDEANSRTVQVV